MGRVTTPSTGAVIVLLEGLIGTHGAPPEVLTDNGSEFGGSSRRSTFDRWCRDHRITHIRSGVHKPTTTGKVERFHQTAQAELPFRNQDYDLFRYRYNQIRPHESLHMQTPAAVYFSIQERLRTPSHERQRWW